MAPKKSRLSAIKPWHILAAMFGAFGLFLSISATSMGTEWPAWAIPIVSAVLVGWLLYQVLPPWVPALLVGGMGLMAAVKVQATKNRDQQQMAESRLDYAMHDVCDGKPLDRDPNGWKLRDFERSKGASYWSTTGGWTAGKIPTYVLCTEHDSQEVSCGDFTDSRDSRVSRLCTYRDLATVTLRRTKTAEVLFTKSYVGGEAPPLPYSVQFGGYNSTKLSGDSVSYEKQIFPDIEKLIAQ